MARAEMTPTRPDVAGGPRRARGARTTPGVAAHSGPYPIVGDTGPVGPVMRSGSCRPKDATSRRRERRPAQGDGRDVDPTWAVWWSSAPSPRRCVLGEPITPVRPPSRCRLRVTASTVPYPELPALPTGEHLPVLALPLTYGLMWATERRPTSHEGGPLPTLNLKLSDPAAPRRFVDAYNPPGDLKPIASHACIPLPVLRPPGISVRRRSFLRNERPSLLDRAAGCSASSPWPASPSS